MEVVASLSQDRTAAAQCGLFTYKSVPVIFEPPCTSCRSISGESNCVIAFNSKYFTYYYPYYHRHRHQNELLKYTL